MPIRARRAAALVLGVLVAAAPLPVSAAKPAPAPVPSSTITFSGYTWTVKDHARKIGPGPNFFSAANVSLNASGQLVMKIQRSRNKWSCAEVILNGSFGYGTYTWRIASAPDLDPNVVLGLFTWNDDPAYAHREIDVEFAKWGNAADPTNGQYTVQPWDRSNHTHRFTQASGLTYTTHSFTWAPGRVDFVSRTSGGAEIARYTYVGSDVPLPGGENPRINLWLFRGSAPQNGQAVTVVIDSFRFDRPG